MLKQDAEELAQLKIATRDGGHKTRLYLEEFALAWQERGNRIAMIRPKIVGCIPVGGALLINNAAEMKAVGATVLAIGVTWLVRHLSEE